MNPSAPKHTAPEVPRDREVDRPASAGKPDALPPSPADHNQPDEEYTDQEKPLVAGSREARALQDRPPSAPGELGVGTAGDAARPTKTGIYGKPIPPRGSL